MPPSDLSPTPGAPDLRLSEGGLLLRFASTAEDLDAALRLRFRVFNLELGEGLDESHETGRDRDPFDAHCHHLIAVHEASDQVVGTYRMQTSEMARTGIGFYSAGEFDMSAMPAEILNRSVELGRACVAEPFRTARALYLLWRGLAWYMIHSGSRYLFGCSSITTQDPTVAARAVRCLEEGGHLHSGFRLQALPAFACPPCPTTAEKERFRLPRLFRTYLDVGAKVCSGPALDRDFKTVDFVTLMDIEELDDRSRAMFF